MLSRATLTVGHHIRLAGRLTAISSTTATRAMAAAASSAAAGGASLPPKHVVIVGGVAGGASTAARLRRLDEHCDITMLERGPYASFGACGLPYVVGRTIPDDAKLLVATPELFKDRFRIDVRTHAEVTSFDPEAKTVTVRGTGSGDRDDPGETIDYDALVLATGAKAVRLQIPGAELPGVFNLRTIPDARHINAWIEAHNGRRAVVVGAGFIGLEIAHALSERGLHVDVVEKSAQLMPPLDAEFGAPVEAELSSKGVGVHCASEIASIAINDKGGPAAGSASAAASASGSLSSSALRVTLESGDMLDTDLVIVAVGAVPESSLAKEAGLELGIRGTISVDEQMRTSAPDVWAVGDVVQSFHVLKHVPELVPLAGVANRQGRVAAESIAGRAVRMRDAQGTAICRSFNITMAMTGMCEKALEAHGWKRSDYESVRLHPAHHASYYPGASPIHLKVCFAAEDGRVLGAQAVGDAHEGIARRIDVIATMIQLGGTVHDMAEAELCYAPQFGSARDPINVAGMIASNVLSGDAPLGDWALVLQQVAEFKKKTTVTDGGDGAEAAAGVSAASAGFLVLDCRTAAEYAEGHIPGAIHIPVEMLRARHAELAPFVSMVPSDAAGSVAGATAKAGAGDAGARVPVFVCCRVGQRAYVATRLLRQLGYDARLLSGGYQTYLQMQSEGARGYVDVVTASMKY